MSCGYSCTFGAWFQYNSNWTSPKLVSNTTDSIESEYLPRIDVKTLIKVKDDERTLRVKLCYYTSVTGQ